VKFVEIKAKQTGKDHGSKLCVKNMMLNNRLTQSLIFYLGHLYFHYVVIPIAYLKLQWYRVVHYRNQRDIRKYMNSKFPELKNQKDTK